MTRTVRFARESVLWLGGLVGALCIASFLASWLLNVTPLVFQSASMSPAYEPGALGIAREVPASSLEPGDVVSVVNAAGDRVTHRVVAADAAAGGRILTLRGDANDAPDAETYRVTTADRVSFGIPYAGYVLAAATTPVGLLAMALLAAGALVLGFGAGHPNGDAGRRAGRARRRSVAVPAGVVSVLVVGGVVGASGGAPWAFTSAVWSDSAQAKATISTVASDATPPVLTDPRPANNAVGASWSALDCADSGAGLSQICVTATDTGGSGLATVTVKLVRTNTNECWNGTSFVSGTGCAARPMTVLSGSQYRTTGLTAAVMTVGVYTATFVATDGDGNTAQLVTTFATDNTGPTLTAYGPANGTSRTNNNSGTNSWRQNCVAFAVGDDRVCVTATDPGGVGVDFASATFTLVGTSDANNGRCWNGTAFVLGTTCSVATNRSGNVIYSGAIPDASPGVQDGTYSLTWKVKDLAGNQTTGTITFTVT